MGVLPDFRRFDMPSFLTLWQGFLEALSDFLLTEPVIYFVGIFVLAAIANIVLIFVPRKGR